MKPWPILVNEATTHPSAAHRRRCVEALRGVAEKTTWDGQSLDEAVHANTARHESESESSFIDKAIRVSCLRLADESNAVRLEALALIKELQTLQRSLPTIDPLPDENTDFELLSKQYTDSTTRHDCGVSLSSPFSLGKVGQFHTLIRAFFTFVERSEFSQHRKRAGCAEFFPCTLTTKLSLPIALSASRNIQKQVPGKGVADVSALLCTPPRKRQECER